MSYSREYRHLLGQSQGYIGEIFGLSWSISGLSWGNIRFILGVMEIKWKVLGRVRTI